MEEKTEFKTKNGHTIVFKEFVTGGDAEQIVLKSAGAQNDEEKGILTGRAMIECTVVSVDGDNTNVLAKVQALHSADYLEVITEATKVVDGGQKKENSTPKP